MATLGELKARIIAETDREDLGSGQESEARLVEAIQRAIEFYQDEDFWFKHAIDRAVTTTAGQQTVAIPATLRFVQTAAYLDEVLRKVPLDRIEANEIDEGPPSEWAENGANIVLWPTPDAAYTIVLAGVANTDPPSSDGSETIWTTYAYDLIAARVRMLLYRDLFRDTQAAGVAVAAEAEALSKLRRETMRRRKTPLRSTGDEPWSLPSTFNIYRGDY